jgi:hypothetical protein
MYYLRNASIISGNIAIYKHWTVTYASLCLLNITYIITKKCHIEYYVQKQDHLNKIRSLKHNTEEVDIAPVRSDAD